MSNSHNFIEAAVAAGWEDALEVNPMTGNRRLKLPHNDVYWAIDGLGGPAQAAAKLGVEEIEVHWWIDGHRVPTRYATRIRRMTGCNEWSIQKPPFDPLASAGA